MGRPAKGPRLVDRLEGSAQAKERLTVILETVSGTRSVASACEVLGLSEAAFHRLRQRTLADAVASLEPRRMGRPPQAVAPETARVAALEQQVARLTLEVEAAQVREQIARTMPRLLDRSRRSAEMNVKKGRRRRPGVHR